VPSRPLKSISSEDTFEKDLPIGDLPPSLARAAERVAAAAARKRRLGRTVTVKLKTSDFRLWTRRRTVARPPADAAELLAVAEALLAEFPADPRLLYRLAGVGLSNFLDEDDDGQAPLFDADAAPPEVGDPDDD